jgi:hypothetical protein
MFDRFLAENIMNLAKIESTCLVRSEAQIALHFVLAGVLEISHDFRQLGIDPALFAKLK